MSSASFDVQSRVCCVHNKDHTANEGVELMKVYQPRDIYVLQSRIKSFAKSSWKSFLAVMTV